MRNKGYIYLCLILGLLQGLQAQESKRIYLSGKGYDDAVSWDFYCTAGLNSGRWSSIDVPSCWEQQGYGEYNYGHVPLDKRLKEEGHYRTTFRAEKSWKGQLVELHFEGVMTDARVLVNGKQAGEIHQGAFYPFSYNIGTLLKYGKENLLEVKVKKYSDNESVNQAERKADYWIFGGIFRPVYLEVHPPAHIGHVAVDARADGAFRAEVMLEGLRKNATLLTLIRDMEGREMHSWKQDVARGAGQCMLETRVEGIEPWNPEYPRLYKAEFQLLDPSGEILHVHRERIGFRTVEVREEDGIYVNGVRVRLKGVNRHSFHPDHGRTSSKSLSIEVVNLIKDMNMNAVRMSHYPPDRHFLDACDSLGLFVLDELAGWQAPSYDSIVGRKLLRTMVRRDVNHPSVVIWDNGNEGGWNTAYDADFGELDIQQRTVIHPWAVHGKINAAHYIGYDYLARGHFSPRKIFIPTEFLHGLYDGGHGAGLADYWKQMWADPLCAGGFLWVFADEAVKRADTGELDSDGNHAPDGILGPYHEKEGSFYSIREIWAPVHIEQRYITRGFNGIFSVENRFHYTPFDQCSFSYRWEILPGPGGKGGKVLQEGDPIVDALQPGQVGKIRVPLPPGWQEAYVLTLEAVDPHGRLIHRWSWPVQSPAKVALAQYPGEVPDGISVWEDSRNLVMEASGIRVSLDKQNGQLREVWSDGHSIPLGEGPVFRSGGMELVSLKHFDREGKHHVQALFEKDQRLEWIMYSSGLLEMKLSYQPETSGGKLQSTGATFSFPEEEFKTLTFVGRGPYRVWKNRLQGPVFGRWEKAWNNTITGHSGFDYPEFKGYYSDFYWARIGMEEGRDFIVYSHTPDLFLKVLQPEESPVPARTTVTHLPGELGFMLGIPPIGTKFKDAVHLGPQSGPYSYDGRRVDGGALQIHLSFDFHAVQ